MGSVIAHAWDIVCGSKRPPLVVQALLLLYRLPTRLVLDRAGVLRQLHDLVWRGERQRAGQGSLEVRFKKLTGPSAVVHEVHVDLALRCAAVAVPFSRPLVGLKFETDLACAANFTCQP